MFFLSVCLRAELAHPPAPWYLCLSQVTGAARSSRSPFSALWPGTEHYVVASIGNGFIGRSLFAQAQMAADALRL
jgi:hypothetical protein